MLFLFRSADHAVLDPHEQRQYEDTLGTQTQNKKALLPCDITTKVVVEVRFQLYLFRELKIGYFVWWVEYVGTIFRATIF